MLLSWRPDLQFLFDLSSLLHKAIQGLILLVVQGWYNLVSLMGLLEKYPWWISRDSFGNGGRGCMLGCIQISSASTARCSDVSRGRRNCWMVLKQYGNLQDADGDSRDLFRNWTNEQGLKPVSRQRLNRVSKSVLMIVCKIFEDLD